MGLQEASPLGSKVPCENLATIERGRAHCLAALRPLLTPSNLSQLPPILVLAMSPLHTWSSSSCAATGHRVSPGLLLGWAEVGG